MKITNSKIVVLVATLMCGAVVSYSQRNLASSVEKAVFNAHIPVNSLPNLQNFSGRMIQFESERMAAQQVLNKLVNPQIQGLTAKGAQQLCNELGFVRNNTLRISLTDAINHNNVSKVVTELENYYSISKRWTSNVDKYLVYTERTENVFVSKTLAYMKDHPHKIPLRLREILKNPNIDAGLKYAIQEFVKMPLLSQNEEFYFISLLRQAYQLHYDDSVTARLSVQKATEKYMEILNNLKEFVSIYKRQPRWNGLPAERELANQVETITHKAQPFQFERTITADIEAVLKAYPKNYLSKEETFELGKNFVIENGFAPRTAQDAENVSEDELILNDNLLHYFIVDPQFLLAWREVLKEIK